MNSNPFPEDVNSGQIKPLDEFNSNIPTVKIGIEGQRILEKIPMHKRVQYLAASTELELADERKQLKGLFDKKKNE